MKKVFCIHEHVFYKAPIYNGYQIEFVNHEAVVPDEVADCIVAMAPNLFQVSSVDIKGEKNRVLVIRDQGIGDMIMTTPLIRWLAVKDGMKVDVLTLECHAPLLAGNPHIDTIYHVETYKKETDELYDARVDLRLFVENQESARIWRNRVDAFLSIAGKKAETDEDRRCDYIVSANERTRAKMMIQKEFPQEGRLDTYRPLIAYVWATSTDNRNWGLPKHMQVIQALLRAGYRVMTLNTTNVPLNIIHSGYSNMGAKTSLREGGAIIEQADAVISPDTGFFHVASALNKPVVAYFGAFPLSERQSHQSVIPVINKQPCLPCHKYYCMCRNGDNLPKCLDVGPDSVVDAVRQAIEQFGSVKNVLGAAA